MDELEKARKEINEADKGIAELFCKRMNAVRAVAEYKKKRGLPILDTAREDAVIAKNSVLVEDEELRSYYVNYLKYTMENMPMTISIPAAVFLIRRPTPSMVVTSKTSATFAAMQSVN